MIIIITFINNSLFLIGIKIILIAPDGAQVTAILIRIIFIVIAPGGAEETLILI